MLFNNFTDQQLVSLCSCSEQIGDNDVYLTSLDKSFKPQRVVRRETSLLSNHSNFFVSFNRCGLSLLFVRQGYWLYMKVMKLWIIETWWHIEGNIRVCWFWLDLYDITDGPGVKCTAGYWGEKKGPQSCSIFSMRLCVSVVHVTDAVLDKRCQNHWAGFTSDRSQAHVCGKTTGRLWGKRKNWSCKALQHFTYRVLSLQSCDWLKYGQGGLIGCRFSTQILLYNNTFNNRVNNLQVKLYLKLHFKHSLQIQGVFWWRHVVYQSFCHANVISLTWFLFSHSC